MRGKIRISIKRIACTMLLLVMIFPSSLLVQASNISNDLHVDYKMYYENYGWSKYSNILHSKLENEDKKIEAIKIENKEDKALKVLYSVYIEDDGWTTFVESGKTVGKISRNTPIKDIRIKLSNEFEKEYNIEYRVCYGKGMWSKWFCNGQKSNKDYTRDLYNLEIRVVKK